MDFFFKPRGIAVVGATPSRDKSGNNIVVNLNKGFKGGIYPVNPRYPEVEGHKCYPSIAQVPDPVDLANVFVGAPLVPDTVRECAKRGIKGVIIQAAGFSETGEAGMKLHNELVGIVRETGIRIWGPNCMGMLDMKNRHIFSFLHPPGWENSLLAGDVSLIVQSGLMSSHCALDAMSHGTVGISKTCSIGNKLDVDESDVLEYLLEDPETKVIGMYLESINDGHRFMQLCKGAGKPIVLLKGGKSADGAKAAMSHTGSMAGDGAVITGALAQAGVVEANDLLQMIDLCKALVMCPEIPETAKKRVAVVTFSGGAGIVNSDFIERTELELSTFSEKTMADLEKIFPKWMPPANPVDLFPAIEESGSGTVLWTTLISLLSDSAVDAMIYHAPLEKQVTDAGFKLLSSLGEFGKPVFMWAFGEAVFLRDFQDRIQKHNIPTFRELYRTVECLEAVFNYYERRHASKHLTLDENRKVIPETCLRIVAEKHGVLDEYQSKEILASLGIPVVKEQIATDLSHSKNIARTMGYPVVLKGIVPGEVHKTELGLIRLNIANVMDLEAAYKELTSVMHGDGQVLIQQQVQGGPEIILGMIRDPQFGPCVMLGLGGVMAEVLDDKAFAVAPLTHVEALSMIKRLKNQRLLNGFRGAPPLDREALATVLVSLGQLGHSCTDILEIDINPMIINNGVPTAVDATIIKKQV